MENNHHLTLENVHIAGVPGMGINIRGRQSHWQMLNCRIAPPEGSKRFVSSTTDGIHVSTSAGYFRMENCEIAYTCDDSMNIHDLNGFALWQDEYHIRAINLRNHASDHFQVGDALELREDNFAPTGFTGKITAFKRIDQRNAEITFAEKVPQPKGQGFVLYNREIGTRNVIIRNNYIHHTPRGLLLLANDVTIENNRFEHQIAGAIKLETGYTFNVWSEGFGVDNVVIRNNSFAYANPRGRYPNENRPDIYLNSYMGCDPSLVKTDYPVIQHIWIADNKFMESTGSPVYVGTAGDVIISGNQVINNEALAVVEPARAAIGMSQAQRVWILNNVWKSTLPGMKSGVLYDPDSVTDLTFEGNRCE
jgi:hypothetical protein